MLRQTSLASIGLIVGGILALVGLIAYATGNSTLNLVGFFYGFPLFLGGLALKITELKPVPLTQPTSPEVLALREQQATTIQNQVRRDVTRYRYGQDVHLDNELGRVGLKPSDDDCPMLVGLYETEIEGDYSLVLEFDSPFVPFKLWQDRQAKLTSFFGPGVEAIVHQSQPNRVSLTLKTKPDSDSGSADEL
jgi:hypothetical protein